MTSETSFLPNPSLSLSGEEVVLKFIEEIKSVGTSESDEKNNTRWLDFSNKWFTLMHSTRPFIIKGFQELADHVAAGLETVRDINVASRLIGDVTGATTDDPLFDRYKKLGCSISALDKDSEDYKMILKYMGKTYEPYKVGEVSYNVSVDNIFEVEPSACPSLDDMKKLPNKILLWCGSRSSNMLRHLHKGFQPALCSLAVPGYMFGRAIVCSDAAAEAARYGFTAVDRPDGFLVLAVVSLGDQIIELTRPPEDTKSLEEKNIGVKGLGRKKTDESEHSNNRSLVESSIEVAGGLISQVLQLNSSPTSCVDSITTIIPRMEAVVGRLNRLTASVNSILSLLKPEEDLQQNRHA